MTDTEETNWSDYDEILGTIQSKKERANGKASR
jgi:hypothetical protein